MDVQIIRLQDVNIKEGLIKIISPEKSILRTLSQQALKCKYIGEYRYNDIVHQNGMPSIVPEDLFNRVQERMAANKKAPPCSLPPFDCRYQSRDSNYCFDNKICNFKGGRHLFLSEDGFLKPS